MATAKKAKAEAPDESLTGVTYGIRAVTTNGFSNFRIVTFFIIDGEIVHEEASQPYAAFEAIARLEVFISASMFNLQHNYGMGSGRLFRMGGEQRDILVKRLEKEGKHALIERIRPAMRF